MKTRTMALAALLLLSGCGRTAPARHPQEPPRKPPGAVSKAAPDHLREDTVAVGEEVFTIRRIGVDALGSGHPVLDRVEVCRGAAPVQSFSDFRADGTPPLDGDLLAEDLNFDGWTDFRVFGGYSSMGEWWYCWLWDPESGGFVYDAVLSDLRECVWDAEKQEIYTAAYGGLSGADYSVYAWEQGELVCLRRFSVCVDIHKPPYSVENRFFARRDGDLLLEHTWRGTAGEWGESLISPAAAEYWKTVWLDQSSEIQEGE